MATVVTPRLQMVADEDGVKAELLGENSKIQQFPRRELLGGCLVTEPEQMVPPTQHIVYWLQYTEYRPCPCGAKGTRLRPSGVVEKDVHSPSEPQWIVVVPFKGAPRGKSRLSPTTTQPGLNSTQRARLALAFLQDTVAAAIMAPRVRHVLVVSSAHEIHRAGVLSNPTRMSSAEKSVSVVRDPGRGLNAAVSKGVRFARRMSPASFIAVLASDLPNLESPELGHALALASVHARAVIADHDGVGSTVLTVAPGFEMTPQFGENSRAAHEGLGHALIDFPEESGLRFDVDTFADLRRAASSGRAVGPATTECIASFTLEAGNDNPRRDAFLTMTQSVVGSLISNNEPGFRLHITNQFLED